MLEWAGSPEEVNRWVKVVAATLDPASPSREPPGADDGSCLLQGDHVVLDNLKSCKALNGRRSIVFKYIIPGEDGAERYAVRVLAEDGPTAGTGDASGLKSVKLHNIILLRHSAKEAVDNRAAEILEAWPSV